MAGSASLLGRQSQWNWHGGSQRQPTPPQAHEAGLCARAETSSTCNQAYLSSAWSAMPPRLAADNQARDGPSARIARTALCGQADGESDHQTADQPRSAQIACRYWTGFERGGVPSTYWPLFELAVAKPASRCLTGERPATMSPHTRARGKNPRYARACVLFCIVQARWWGILPQNRHWRRHRARTAAWPRQLFRPGRPT